MKHNVINTNRKEKGQEKPNRIKWHLPVRNLSIKRKGVIMPGDNYV